MLMVYQVNDKTLFTASVYDMIYYEHVIIILKLKTSCVTSVLTHSYFFDSNLSKYLLNTRVTLDNADPIYS